MRNFFLLDYELAKLPVTSILFFLVTLVLCLFWLLNPAHISLLMPDSTSYIDFQDYRGAGYPAFLSLFITLGFSIESIPIVQNILFFITLGFLACAFNQRYRSVILGIALIIGIGLNPAIVRYNFSIITESVYFSSLFIILAVLLKICFQRTSRGRIKRPLNYVILGLVFSWLILIKPVSWSFIVIPILVIWQHISLRENTFRAISFILIGFLCMQVLGTAYRYSVHQQFSGSSFFGNQLIGKLAFTSFDPSQTPYPQAGELWLEIMESSHKARESLDTHGERFIYSLNTYDYLRFDNMPAIVELMETSDKSNAQKDLALSVLKQNPKSYGYDVGLNFYHLWSIGELRFKSFSEAYNQKVKRLISEFGDKIPKPYILNEDKSLQIVILKPLLAIIAALNFVTLIYGFIHFILFRPKSSLFTHIFVIACSVNAYFLLTALLQAALIRYAIIAWPMHLLLLFGLLILLRNKAFKFV